MNAPHQDLNAQWSGSTLKRYKRKIRLAWQVLRRGESLPIGDAHFRVPRDLHPMFRYRVLRARDYEVEETTLCDSWLPRDHDTIELGACLGVLSVRLRRLLDEDRHLLVAEAQPRLAAAALSNLELHAAAQSWQVVNAAVGPQGNAFLPFDHRTSPHEGRLSRSANRLLVPCFGIEELMHLLPRPGACNLVMDVEGTEWDLFAEKSAAWARVHTLVLETHPQSFAARGESADSFQALLKSHGFQHLQTLGDSSAWRGPAGQT